ncbi:MAG: hypothetical protein WC496_07445 [Phycisphaerae bacterium]|jgi:hypothetical protein
MMMTYAAQVLGQTIVWLLFGILFYCIAKLCRIPKGLFSVIASIILNLVILMSPLWNKKEFPDLQSVLSFVIAYSVLFFVCVMCTILKCKKIKDDVIVYNSKLKTQN